MCIGGVRRFNEEKNSMCLPTSTEVLPLLNFQIKKKCHFTSDGTFEHPHSKGLMSILNDDNWLEEVTQLMYLTVIKSTE